ncbi:MAG: SDR family NAD(P)-dependent oxidoreductase, partial [Acidimicrobiia bacterium]
MRRLDGTRVLVTGATSGLGLAMADALVDAGARVAVSGRSRARAESVAVRLGSSAVGLELDVRDERSVQQSVDQLYERWGGLDVLVNNAG